MGRKVSEVVLVQKIGSTLIMNRLSFKPFLRSYIEATEKDILNKQNEI